MKNKKYLLVFELCNSLNKKNDNLSQIIGFCESDDDQYLVKNIFNHNENILWMVLFCLKQKEIFLYKSPIEFELFKEDFFPSMINHLNYYYPNNLPEDIDLSKMKDYRNHISILDFTN